MKSSSWKKFDFAPSKRFKNDEEITKSLTINETITKPKIKNVNIVKQIDFFNKLKPKKIEELAVHSKKIEEVKTWFEKTFLLQNYHHSPILLITGPTGCGKTATVYLLSELMNIYIREWINTVDYDYEINRTANQVTRFNDFLVTEANFKSLFSDQNKNQLMLVKDFPNVFLIHHEEFLNVLEECYYNSKSPIVFIMTDSNSSNIVNQLFPEDAKQTYSITHISFNSCAPTLLKKCLKRAQTVVEQYKGSFSVPSSEAVELILASSLGDIRSALSQYYFASIIDKELANQSLNISKPKGRKQNKKAKLEIACKIIGKDEALSLFHGIGRILNPKRIDMDNSWRLDCDINGLVSKFDTQPKMLISFLFHNYPKYFGDLKDVCQAVEKLSISNLFLQKWFESTALNEYPIWIAVMGLMIFNRHRVKSWNPIRKPDKISKRILLHSPLDEYYLNVIKNVSTAL